MATGALVALAVGSIASAGVSIASAAGAFDSGAPKVPTRSDPRVEDQRRRQLRAARNAKGSSSTILTKLTDTDASTQSATLLGQSAKVS